MGKEGSSGDEGLFRVVNVGIAEVLGALNVLKLGIMGELNGSWGAYMGGGIAPCVYGDMDIIILLSEEYASDISAFVALRGVKVGTTCVSVAFSAVKEEIKG